MTDASFRFRLERAALEYAIHRPELVARDGVRSDNLLDPVLREAFAALEKTDTFDEAISAAGPDAELALWRAFGRSDGFTPWILIRNTLLESDEAGLRKNEP